MSDQELRRTLEETLALLQAVGETVWSAKIGAALRTSIDPDGLITWFGGMGSFSDVLLAPANGHRMSPGEETMLNDKLDTLRARIHDLVRRDAASF
jgi:hypothetical protein